MREERDPILQEHLAALRSEEDPHPPEGLVNRAWTRAVVERRRDQEAGGLAARLRRALRPRMVRLRVAPALGLALVSAAVAAVWVARTPVSTVPDASPPVATPAVSAGAPAPREAAPPKEVPVRFVLPAEEARSVAVAGDFNDWRTDELLLDDPEGNGVFVGTAWLRPGTYSYMFVVDGERWVTDPYASNHRNDGFGQQNAVLRID
ncbi:MAG: glycogen-binding domain-containing protein [Myxococcota bacterium]